MTKLSDIISRIFENKFAASFDISKAYFHVPISQKYIKYFSFKFELNFYNLNAMPFRLNTST